MFPTQFIGGSLHGETTTIPHPVPTISYRESSDHDIETYVRVTHDTPLIFVLVGEA